MKNDDFLAQLILKANPDIDEAGLEMLIGDAELVLQERVFTNIIKILNPDQRKKLIDLTNGKNYVSGQAYKYLCSVIPNYETFIGNIYEDFEKMYLKNLKDFMNM